MKRLIVTGPNGAGKSHLAAQLAALRPEVPVVSFDALKLTEGWVQRPRAEVETALQAEIEKEAWILEGGPSLLPLAAPRADAVLWLDPPWLLRARRLLVRPWKHFGKTRPELPQGNVDWPWAQYRFAARSLSRDAQFQASVAKGLEGFPEEAVWRCRAERDLRRFFAHWA